MEPHLNEIVDVAKAGARADTFGLIPASWYAAEDLVSPDLVTRRNGLARLLEFDAVRQSPLTVFLLATRITDPEIALRTSVVKVLGGILDLDGFDKEMGEDVSLYLVDYLTQIRTRQVFALLQVVEYDPSARGDVIRLLHNCSQSASYLSDILKDRKAPLEIRRLSVQMIGEIGYINAVPALDRLTSKLESRLNGQRLEGSNQVEGEQSLLPLIKEALELLRAP